jgi:hypothetical protein
VTVTDLLAILTLKTLYNIHYTRNGMRQLNKTTSKARRLLGNLVRVITLQCSIKIINYCNLVRLIQHTMLSLPIPFVTNGRFSS